MAWLHLIDLDHAAFLKSPVSYHGLGLYLKPETLFHHSYLPFNSIKSVEH